jgi:hypothetical protein
MFDCIVSTLLWDDVFQKIYIVVDDFESIASRWLCNKRFLHFNIVSSTNQSTNTKHTRRRREINHAGRTGRMSFASTYQDLVCVLGAVEDIIIVISQD